MSFSHERAMDQMRVNCARDNLPWFVEGIFGRGRDFITVAGGPSLRTRLDSVKARQKKGGMVLACNGAARLLKQNGIKPDAIAFLDIGESVLGFIDDEPDEVIYLVASIVNPKVIDRLLELGRRVVLWHCDYGEGRNEQQKAIIDQYPGKPAMLIGGGNTIGVRSLPLGFLMGFRSFHIYGLDSSFADDGSDHAYQKHDGVEPESVPVKFEGKTYRCSPWMAKQAAEFEFYYRQYTGNGCKIFVHGEGLIPDIWRSLRHDRRLAA